MVVFQERKDGVVLSVWAKPGSSKNEVLGLYRSCLKISVQAPPEKGKANRAIEKLLQKELGITKDCIELISGDTSKEKRFLIRGNSLHELEDKLSELIS